MNRRDFVRQGMRAAAELRDRLDLDPFGPVDPYCAAERLGVRVRFLDTSMEGFYFRQGSGRILLSSLRPVPRRAFTCAHELGHHWFGHGSTIDQLQADERPDTEKPEEILANSFAAFLLMPTIGLRAAFVRRGWDVVTATPVEVFTVACQFGVGYTTLVNHLGYSLGEISLVRRAELGRWTPQKIRRRLFDDDHDTFIVVDEHGAGGAFDVETGAAVLLPPGLGTVSDAVERVRSLVASDLYVARKRGRATISGAAGSFEIRVMPRDYVGPAGNRFLEDPDEQD